MSQRFCGQLGFALLAGLLVCVAVDAMQIDLPVARWSGGANGFSLVDDEWLDSWLYDAPKLLALVGVLMLFAAVRWPMGLLSALSKTERWALALQVLALAALVPGIKRFTSTACPWDLLEFGSRTPYISHWDFSQATEFVGHCFPAGHAVNGFAFLPLAFALWPYNRRQARFVLALVLVGGFALGVSQQVRGAHFVSHTLWSAWICAALAMVLSWLCRKYWLTARFV